MMASGPSVALDDLDLLRTGSLDSGATTLLDPSACSDTLSFESFRHDSGSGEGALVALRDGDGERLCPPSSEIARAARSCAQSSSAQGRPPPTWAETRANPLANISCATEWDARSSMT